MEFCVHAPVDDGEQSQQFDLTEASNETEIEKTVGHARVGSDAQPMSVTGSIGEASEHGGLGMQCVSRRVANGSELCAEPEQRRKKRENITAVRAQESRQTVR